MDRHTHISYFLSECVKNNVLAARLLLKYIVT